MGTKLGEISIDAVEGNTLRGSFTSVYERNVYTAYPKWGAEMLVEAWEQAGSPDDAFIGRMARKIAFPPQSLEDRLLKHVVSVTFETPNTSQTAFTVEVDDAAVLEGIEPTWWESYFFG